MRLGRARLRRRPASTAMMSCVRSPRRCAALLPLYLLAVCSVVIKSFGDRPTEALFGDRFVREFQGVARQAKRKLEMLHAANRLDDLRATIQPSGKAERKFERVLLDPDQRSVASDLPVD